MAKTIRGTNGRDQLWGDAFNNKIYGYSGNDYIFCPSRS